MFRVACYLAKSLPDRVGLHSALLPKRVFGEEIVVRAIFSPYHVSSNGEKLKPKAFAPSPETDEISIMRKSFLGHDQCKRKAHELESPEHHKVYRGFAVMYVYKIRSLGCQVVDSRDEFLGHADIRTGIACPPRGIPMEPEMRAKSDSISANLLKISEYIMDSRPILSRRIGQETP